MTMNNDGFVDDVANRVKSVLGSNVAICKKKNGIFTFTRLEPANVYGMKIDLFWEDWLRILGEGGFDEEIALADKAVETASDLILRVATGGVAQRRLGPLRLGRQIIADERIEAWVRRGRRPFLWHVWEPW